ncbi:MAG: glycosyltransferase family 4 protein [Planctomycetota bacterium]
MHVAYLVNQYPQPSQSFIRREIAALEDLGHRVSRFTLRRFDGDLPDPRDEAEREKTTVVLARGAKGLATDVLSTAAGNPASAASSALSAWRASRKVPSRRAVYGVYFAEAAALKRMLDPIKVDHVHAHFGTNSAEVARLCHRLGGPPYSFTCHGPEEFDQPLALDLGGKVAESKFAVAVSSFGRSQLWRWTDYEHWDKVKVVHCGIDGSFLDAEPTPIDTDSGDFVCVGRLAEQKGQLVLVRAAGKLKDVGLDFHILLLGEGPLRPILEAEIARLDLGRHVTLHGLASGDEVRSRMAGSRATVLPSFAEGLPVVLMESLALGRPAVTTTVAGIPELVTPDTGWLVPAGDVDRLAEAMRQVLSADAATLSAMGSAGRNRVAQRHDASTEAQTLANLFGSAS